MIEYCFSRVLKYVKARDGKTYPGERINHIQGNGKTACGIPYGMYWDYDITDDLNNITCLRCRNTKQFKNGESAQIPQ